MIRMGYSCMFGKMFFVAFFLSTRAKNGLFCVFFAWQANSLRWVGTSDSGVVYGFVGGLSSLIMMFFNFRSHHPHAGNAHFITSGRIFWLFWMKSEPISGVNEWAERANNYILKVALDKALLGTLSLEPPPFTPSPEIWVTPPLSVLQKWHVHIWPTLKPLSIMVP